MKPVPTTMRAKEKAGKNVRRFRPRVQALVRIGSAVARLVPLDTKIFREFLILGSDVFKEYEFTCTFKSVRLNVLWSARAFPELITKHMLFHGLYQPEVLLWIKRHCKKGDIVFDIGAFHGLMTIVASKAVGRNGKVIAFEPNPNAREHLLLHLELNRCRNVSVEPLGLIDELGYREFYAQIGDLTWNSSFIRDFVDPKQNLKPLQVQCTTVDAYVQETGLVPNFMKIDTEGTEALVLKGARETIGRHKPILVLEFNPWSAAEAGTSIEEIAKSLKDLGYALKVIRPTRWGRYKFKNEEPFHETLQKFDDLVNVICTPQ